MSAKFTGNTLQLTVIEYPRRTVTVQIAFETRVWSSTERVEIFTTLVFNIYADPMLTRHVRRIGVADQQTRHGKQRVDAKYSNTPSKFLTRYRRKRSMSTEFILQSRRLRFYHDPPRSRFRIRRKQRQ